MLSYYAFLFQPKDDNTCNCYDVGRYTILYKHSLARKYKFIWVLETGRKSLILIKKKEKKKVKIWCINSWHKTTTRIWKHKTNKGTALYCCSSSKSHIEPFDTKQKHHIATSFRWPLATIWAGFEPCSIVHYKCPILTWRPLQIDSVYFGFACSFWKS